MASCAPCHGDMNRVCLGLGVLEEYFASGCKHCIQAWESLEQELTSATPDLSCQQEKRHE